MDKCARRGNFAETTIKVNAEMIHVDTVAPETRIASLTTPSLVLDAKRMRHNVARLKDHLKSLGVPLRPHLKTAKSIEIARLLMETPEGPATVSTLKEAEQFAAAGVRDILYAVGISPAKLSRVVELRRQGINISVILDSREQAEAVAAASRAAKDPIPVLIEIDSDGHRAGIKPGAKLLTEVGFVLHKRGAELRGVMTHAGGSYNKSGAEAHAADAEQERAAAVACAEQLRNAGFPCPVVSVGSTPTALFTKDLTGVTEVRAGVFAFMDLVMAGIGVCTVDDIALSVLATVIGHQKDRGLILVDAGWMAMSQDRGTSSQAVDQGHGIVCRVNGRPYTDLIMSRANQEHGLLSLRPGSTAELPYLEVGAQVSILPNHACSTAAQFDRYHVAADYIVTDVWPRFSGW